MQILEECEHYDALLVQRGDDEVPYLGERARLRAGSCGYNIKIMDMGIFSGGGGFTLGEVESGIG